MESFSSRTLVELRCPLCGHRWEVIGERTGGQTYCDASEDDCPECHGEEAVQEAEMDQNA